MFTSQAPHTPRGSYPLHGDCCLDLGGHRIHPGGHAEPVEPLILLANGILCIDTGTLHILLLKGLGGQKGNHLHRECTTGLQTSTPCLCRAASQQEAALLCPQTVSTPWNGNEIPLGVTGTRSVHPAHLKAESGTWNTWMPRWDTQVRGDLPFPQPLGGIRQEASASPQL